MTNYLTLIQSWTHNSQVNAVLIALGVVIITAILSHLLTSFVRRIAQIDGAPVPSSSLIVNVLRVLVWGLAACIILAAFGVNVTALIAAMGVGGIALSLGLKDTIANVLGGIQATFLKIAQPGDYITVGGVSGVVQDVTWRQTVVKDIDNTTHIIPNAIINASTVSTGAPAALVVVPFSTMGPYEDIDALATQMEAAAKAAVEEVAPLQRDPWVLFYEAGDYGIHGKMRFILEKPELLREARDAALRAIAPYLGQQDAS